MAIARNAGRARARKGEAQELLNGNNLTGIKATPIYTHLSLAIFHESSWVLDMVSG